MDIGTGTCPDCGAGLVDRVVQDARGNRHHAERVGVKCSNPHCGYQADRLAAVSGP